MGRKSLNLRTNKSFRGGGVYMTNSDKFKFNNRFKRNPALWLDASHGVKTPVDALVSKWGDRRGHGLYVEQTTGGLQPTLDGDKIVFDGVLSVMQGLPTFDGDFTYSFKLQNLGDTNDPSIFLGKSVTGNEIIFFRYGNLWVRSDVGVFHEITGYDIGNGIEIVHIVRSGNDYSFYQGDIFIETVSISGAMKPDILGGKLDPHSSCFEGNIFDVRIDNRALSQSEITTITRELS